jgi:glucose uptake protein GlcU
MGYLFAFGAFICIGSYLVPVRFSTAKGLRFVPLMGIGMLVVELTFLPYLTALWTHPLWFWGSIFSGILWAFGQGLGNMALEEISLAKAVVFFNFNSFINIASGLILFKEASGLGAYSILLAGGILLFLGAWWVARVSATPTKEGNLKKGTLLSLAAGFFWGIYFIPVKALQVWAPEPSLTFLNVLSGLLLGGAVSIVGSAMLLGTKGWNVRNLGWGLLTAVLWTVGTACFLASIQTLGLSRAVPMVNANTLVYAVWSLFVFKEFPISQGPKLLGGTLLVLGGVVLMAFSN